MTIGMFVSLQDQNYNILFFYETHFDACKRTCWMRNCSAFDFRLTGCALRLLQLAGIDSSCGKTMLKSWLLYVRHDDPAANLELQPIRIRADRSMHWSKVEHGEHHLGRHGPHLYWSWARRRRGTWHGLGQSLYLQATKHELTTQWPLMFLHFSIQVVGISGHSQDDITGLQHDWTKFSPLPVHTHPCPWPCWVWPVILSSSPGLLMSVHHQALA